MAQHNHTQFATSVYAVSTYVGCIQEYGGVYHTPIVPWICTVAYLDIVECLCGRCGAAENHVDVVN